MTVPRRIEAWKQLGFDRSYVYIRDGGINNWIFGKALAIASSRWRVDKLGIHFPAALGKAK